MNHEPISVIDAAQRLGLRKQAVFKILKRLGIETFKERNPAHGGQAIAYISLDDFSILENDMLTRNVAAPMTDSDELDSENLYSDSGVFYLIQLEPEHDAGRFKVGFAVNISERWRSHRCSAPFAVVTRIWTCKRSWERTAIDSVTVGCEQLHTEVFRCNNLESVITKCDQFFAIMPAVSNNGTSIADADDEQSDARKAAAQSFLNSNFTPRSPSSGAPSEQG